MKNTKGINGITLISLVITIVILLILAGVSINMVIGDNGLINKSKYAKFMNEYSEVLEAVDLYKTENTVDSVSPDNINQDELNNKKYPIKGDKLEINSEGSLGKTIMQVENITDLTNKDIYYIDLNLINKNVQNNYVIDTECGKVFQYEGTKLGNIVYHYPNLNTASSDATEAIPENTYLSLDMSKTSDFIKWDSIKTVSTLNDLSDNNKSSVVTDVIINSTNDGLKFAGTSTSEITFDKLGITYPCTISMAIKPSGKTDELLFTDYTSGIALGAYTDNGKMVMVCSNQKVGTYDLESTTFFDGNVKYLTAVYDSSSSFKLYLDGEELTTMSGHTNSWQLNSTTKAYFGQRYTQYTNYPFKGEMYDFRIIKRKLSADEIRTSYNQDKDYLEGISENINNGISRSDILLEYLIKNRNCAKIYDNLTAIKDSNENELNCTSVSYDNEEKCATFNGTNSVVDGTLSEPLAFPCTVTIAIKPNSKNLNQIIFADNTSGIIIGNFIYNNDSTKNVFCLGKDNVQSYKVPDSYYDGSIQYLTIVYNTSLADNKLYLNGQEAEKSDVVTRWSSNSTTKTYIGTRDYLVDYKNWLKASLYNFKIYKNAMTIDQVQQVYASDKNKFER